uniref:Uncharacterized protein n=1 Tax=Bos indicus x Bos taurus TaxID=30522 RepID=A0A4W2CKT4_BOBOX
MATKEMKAAKSREQLALQPLEGVDLSPKQDEGMLEFIKEKACILPCGLEKAIQCVDKREHSIVYLNTCMLSAMLGRRSSRSHQMLS